MQQALLVSEFGSQFERGRAPHTQEGESNGGIQREKQAVWDELAGSLERAWREGFVKEDERIKGFGFWVSSILLQGLCLGWLRTRSLGHTQCLPRQPLLPSTTQELLCYTEGRFRGRSCHASLSYQGPNLPCYRLSSLPHCFSIWEILFTQSHLLCKVWS